MVYIVGELLTSVIANLWQNHNSQHARTAAGWRLGFCNGWRSLFYIMKPTESGEPIIGEAVEP